ncbi:DUF6118 family protein [Sphingomonas sp. PL20]|uniref:DUF6118 family protein n=1 Tax=Sphingomonas sp. PL20 TaxID=2760712 RepID=UPI001AE7D7CB
MADEDDSEDQAAQAFESLRAEVSLMRRAVERLAAERAEDRHVPDYSETLGVISRNLSATAQRVDALVKSPALSLTPEETGRQIDAASFTARREDHRLFLAAKQGMDEVAARLSRHLQSDIAAGEQRRRLGYAGLIGLVAGMAVWAILPGGLARAMPESWHWPERMAARTLGLPMWDGGQRLMAVASPDAWRGITGAATLARDNRDAIGACRTAAARAKKAVRCTIEVKAEE